MHAENTSRRIPKKMGAFAASGGKDRVTWVIVGGRHSFPPFIILHIWNPGYSWEGLRAPGNNHQRLLASSVVILQLFLFLFVLSAIYFAMYLENKMDWWMGRGMDGSTGDKTNVVHYKWRHILVFPVLFFHLLHMFKIFPKMVGKNSTENNNHF